MLGNVVQPYVPKKKEATVWWKISQYMLRYYYCHHYFYYSDQAAPECISAPVFSLNSIPSTRSMEWFSNLFSQILTLYPISKERHSEHFPISHRTKPNALDPAFPEFNVEQAVGYGCLSERSLKVICISGPGRGGIRGSTWHGWKSSWKQRHWCCNSEESRIPRSKIGEVGEEWEGCGIREVKEEDVRGERK